jgi:Scaffold domain
MPGLPAVPALRDGRAGRSPTASRRGRAGDGPRRRLTPCRRLAAAGGAALLPLVLLHGWGCRAQAPAASAARNQQIQNLLRAAVATPRVPAPVRRHAERRRAWMVLQELYRQRGWQPAWWDGTEMRPAAGRLLAALDALPAEGMDPRIYGGPESRRLLDAVTAPGAVLGGGAPGAVPGGSGRPGVADPTESRRAAEVADLEVALSYTFLVVAAHLSSGRVQPAENGRVGWHTVPPRVDLAAAWRRALGGGGVGGWEWQRRRRRQRRHRQRQHRHRERQRRRWQQQERQQRRRGRWRRSWE